MCRCFDGKIWQNHVWCPIDDITHMLNYTTTLDFTWFIMQWLTKDDIAKQAIAGFVLNLNSGVLLFVQQACLQNISERIRDYCYSLPVSITHVFYNALYGIIGKSVL